MDPDVVNGYKLQTQSSQVFQLCDKSISSLKIIIDFEHLFDVSKCLNQLVHATKYGIWEQTKIVRSSNDCPSKCRGQNIKNTNSGQYDVFH